HQASRRRKQRAGADPGRHRNEAPGLLLGLEELGGVVGGIPQGIGAGGIDDLGGERGGPRGEQDRRREEEVLHTRASRNSLKRRTPIPVGPLPMAASSRSLYAVPAMSRWAQGNPSANSRRNHAAEM